MDLFSKAPQRKEPPKTANRNALPEMKCGCRFTGFTWQRCNQGATLLLNWMADLQNIEKRNNYFLHYNQTK